MKNGKAHPKKTNIPERVSCHFSKFYCNVCAIREMLMFSLEQFISKKLCLNFLQRSRVGQELKECERDERSGMRHKKQMGNERRTPQTYIVAIARDANEITPRITDSNQSKTLRTIRLASTTTV